MKNDDKNAGADAIASKSVFGDWSNISNWTPEQEKAFEEAVIQDHVKQLLPEYIKWQNEQDMLAINGDGSAAHVHEWHVITRLTNGWQDVCVTCGEHRIQLWCAMCGKYTDHTSGGCPDLKQQNAALSGVERKP